MKNKKRTKEKEKRTKATIALSQIFILVIATIAFSWMIGSEVKIVSAAGEVCGSGGVCTNQNLCAAANIISGSCSSVGEDCCKNSGVYQTCSSMGGICTSTNDCLSKGTTISPTNSECTSGNICCQAASTPSNSDENSGGGGGSGLFGGAVTIALNAGTNAAIDYLKKKAFGKVANDVGSELMMGDGKGGFSSINNAGGYNTLNPGPTSSKSHWLGNILKGPVGNILINAAAAAATALMITHYARQLASQRNAGDITAVTWIGAGIGTFVASVFGSNLLWGPIISAGITILATALYMLVGYQLYSQEVYTFRPGLWQPTSIGSECSKCNSLTVGTTGEKACSEYICHSYGTACNWTNDNTQYETCVEVNKGDLSPPVIKPVKNIYGEDVFPITDNANYDYTISQAGAKITYKGEGAGTGYCVPAFTPIILAFNTSENAECKLSLEPSSQTGTDKEKFDKMKDLAEGTAYTINHTLQLPASVTADTASLTNAGYELTNGGTFKFYIRCKDVRGNINTVDYIMQFCTQTGPDTRPPQITGTNPPRGSYITYGADKIQDFQLFTNEPAECKWDTKKVSYTDMAHTFSRCSQNLNDPLSEFDFGCQDNLTGFKSGVENKYYVACKDHPEWKGDAATEAKRNTGRPEEILFQGTIRLMINNVKINEKPNNSLIRGSEENVNVLLEVMTSGGAEQGKARCMYSEDGKSYSLFSNEGSRDYLTTNTETLSMSAGNYKLLIQCYDIATPMPNLNTTLINFSVQVDTSAPSVVRVYKDENSDYLRLITDEVAECVYSTTSECTYLLEDGTEMETTDGLEHSIEWNPESDFYIKCIDEFSHAPADGECSIIVRPFEIAQQA
jgi:hypothetical protein